MVYDRILIRYGEISTKGRNRRLFVEKLRKSINFALSPYPKAKIEANRDRMYVLLNGEDAKEIMALISKIFGIQSYSPAIKVNKELETMKAAAYKLVKSLYTGEQTFK